jgi:hypothetical protein
MSQFGPEPATHAAAAASAGAVETSLPQFGQYRPPIAIVVRQFGQAITGAPSLFRGCLSLVSWLSED